MNTGKGEDVPAHTMKVYRASGIIAVLINCDT